MVALGATQPGYRPSTLGLDNLGWESSQTLNLGLDYGLKNGRVTGDLNFYHTTTTDLLLSRSISPVHGITSITQNIGKTKNRGVEFSIRSNNVVSENFKWSSMLNFSFNKNEILSLYGELDEDGNEIDDIANRWFIGEPINVHFGYIWDGVWQSNEAEAAAAWDSQPGFVKIRDVNGDGVLNQDDRQIIGYSDPRFIWGTTQTVSYKNVSLSFFIHGVHGHMKSNPLLDDNDVWPQVQRNTIRKNWWTPDNPTNDWYMNHVNARLMSGQTITVFERAGFVRVKDISLSYDVPPRLLERIRVARLRPYVTARNLFTFTNYTGMDPELSDQRGVPLQREYVFGVTLNF